VCGGDVDGFGRCEREVRRRDARLVERGDERRNRNARRAQCRRIGKHLPRRSSPRDAAVLEEYGVVCEQGLLDFVSHHDDGLGARPGHLVVGGADTVVGRRCVGCHCFGPIDRVEAVESAASESTHGREEPASSGGIEITRRLVEHE